MRFQDMASFCSGKQGERGLPTAARHIPALLMAAIARRRRTRGFYDGRTLALFRAAWQRNRSLVSLVEYALFRRDLGYPLPKRWQAQFAAELDSLRPRRRRLALSLLAESAPEIMTSVPLDFLAKSATAMAPLAFFFEQRNGKTPRSWLARLHGRQHVWQDAFFLQLRQRAGEGICLVGNAGNLRTSGLGNKIDEHGLVVRFNQFSGPKSVAEDLGLKLDVWVAAPGFSGQPPKGVDWVVSSGPDVRFRRQNWTIFEERLSCELPVLTVPLPIWRNLVAELSAPPSAGVLILAWIRVILGSWKDISTVGIGVPPAANVPYHHVLPKQQPFGRHNWEKERFLLSRWRSEGLLSHEFPCRE